MSHELLLVGGHDHILERERRAALVRHAAAAIPGAVSHLVTETPHVAIALVETSPLGGDYAELQDAAEEVRLHIATTELGLTAARGQIADGMGTGAEAGHIRVAVTSNGSVDLSTDGMAFLPCFWAEHQGRLHLSTHLASMVSLGVPADEDTAGVLQYLVMFHPLQQRTLLSDAHLLPPGGHLHWRPAAPVKLTERPLFVPSDLAMTDDEALATYRDVWSTVVNDAFDRNQGSRTVLALSGGLDSRTIASASAALDIRPLAYTYGDDGKREKVVASQVARRLRLAHLTIPVTDDRLLSGADAIAARLDGAHGPSEMYELWFGDVLRSFADVVLHGMAGGPLWGDDKTVGLSNPVVVLDQLVGRHASEAAAIVPFLETLDAADVAAMLRSGIADSMSVWDFSARADTAVYWRLANRQLRWEYMLVTALRRAGLRIEAPFLDSRFLQFAAKLTPRQRLNGSLYLRIHREVFTPTADIARSDDGNSPQNLNHVYWSGDTSYVAQLAALTRQHPIAGARRASRRSFRVGADALGRRTGLTGPSDWLATRSSVFPAEAWLRSSRTYRNRLADLVERAAGAHPMLSDDQVNQAVLGIRAGEPTASALTLAKVGTLGLWLREYSARAEAVRRL